MDSYKPKDDEERKFIELYDSISQETLKNIRALSEEKRSSYLRATVAGLYILK